MLALTYEELKSHKGANICYIQEKIILKTIHYWKVGQKFKTIHYCLTTEIKLKEKQLQNECYSINNIKVNKLFFLHF